jgi:hypothetical protein
VTRLTVAPTPEYAHLILPKMLTFDSTVLVALPTGVKKPGAGTPGKATFGSMVEEGYPFLLTLQCDAPPMRPSTRCCACRSW